MATEQTIYLTLPQLLVGVGEDPRFQHEIRGKRVKKELSNLQEYQHHNVTFQKYALSSSGISIYVQVQYKNSLVDFEIVLCDEYPFSGPLVLLQQANSRWANCLNLLPSMMETTWGPSILLNTILDNLPDLARKIEEEVKGAYHINEVYTYGLLRKYKVKLFEVEEYMWKYLIRFVHQKVIAVTKDYFLKFAREGQGLRLEMCWGLKHLTEAKATLQNDKFKIEIKANHEDQLQTIYLGGQAEDMEDILYHMDPISVIERRLSREKDSQEMTQEAVEEKVSQYNELIQYYAMKDPGKTQTFVNALQQLAATKYQSKEQQMMGGEIAS